MSTPFSPPALTVDLRGQVALVTGASSGLGRRFAETLSSAGASVVLAGRRTDRLKALEQEIQSRGGIALAIELDARDPQSITAAVEQAEKALGLITILINNAGVGAVGRAHEVSLELIDDVIDTNFRGPFLLAAAVASRLIAMESPGRIVNISSVGAYAYSAHTAAALYCATKSAVLRLTETLALDWARYGINVNAIAPGMFRTEMSEAHIRNADQMLKAFPRGRVCEPPDLDSTLLYLVAPASHCVTGISILVDDAQFSR